MDYTTLRLDRRPPLGYLVLDRPDRLNAANRAMWNELDAALADLAGDDEVAVLIVTGSGRAFSAGADLKEMPRTPPPPLSAIVSSQRIQRIMNRLENLGKPSIAAVNGHAVGGGCEIAMACTIRIASERATFGLPEIDLGVIPGTGAVQRLVRLVGHGRAIELLITGDTIDAHEAQRIGLVNRVVSHERLMDTAEELARRLAAKSWEAVALTIAAANLADEGSREVAGLLASALFGLCLSSEDHAQRRKDFLDRVAAKRDG